MRPYLIGAVLAAAFAGGTAAADRVESAEAFRALRADIEADLRDGETYAELGGRDRERASELLELIERRLDSAGTVDAMAESDRLALFNEQEELNALLLEAREDSRLVCQREHQVGSRMPVRRCLTVAQRRRDAERAQDEHSRRLRDMGRTDL